MPLSAQQLAAQKTFRMFWLRSWQQRILKGEYEPAPFCPVRLSWASNLE